MYRSVILQDFFQILRDKYTFLRFLQFSAVFGLSARQGHIFKRHNIILISLGFGSRGC